MASRLGHFILCAILAALITASVWTICHRFAAGREAGLLLLAFFTATLTYLRERR
jgi:hypothetical protein